MEKIPLCIYHKWAMETNQFISITEQTNSFFLFGSADSQSKWKLMLKFYVQLSF